MEVLLVEKIFHCQEEHHCRRSEFIEEEKNTRIKNLAFELINTDGRLSSEDFIRSISTGSVNLQNEK
jgi:hypothetical protein